MFFDRPVSYVLNAHLKYRMIAYDFLYQWKKFSNHEKQQLWNIIIITSGHHFVDEDQLQ